MDWIDRVVDRVAQHEGRYDSINRNTDGAGLSFGILQWAQRTGDLGNLLAAMYGADSRAFRRIFGPSAFVLLDTTRRGALDPVPVDDFPAAARTVLWKEPWVSRFREAGGYTPFQRVQRVLATRGVHFAAAKVAAEKLGAATERSLALFFDTAVQQGAETAKKLADRTLHVFGLGRVVPYLDVLNTYAGLSAGRARALGAEPPPPKNPSLSWRGVDEAEGGVDEAEGGAWHLFARDIDLYDRIRARRFGIIEDDGLNDDEIDLDAAPAGFADAFGDVPAKTPQGSTRPAQDYALRVRDTLFRAADRLHAAGRIDGAAFSSIGWTLAEVEDRIRNPPRNRLGYSCWDLSSSSQTSVVLRWIHGGGNVGVLASGILGPKPWWWPKGAGNDVSLEEMLNAAGLETIHCPDYFREIRTRYDAVGKTFGAHDVRAAELAEAASEGLATQADTDAALRSPPGSPSLLGLLGWLVVLGVGFKIATARR